MTHRQSGRHHRPRATRYLAVAIALLAGLAIWPLPAGAATANIGPTDPDITFVGRWDTRNGAAYVPGWAGSYHGDAVFQGLTLDSGAQTYAPAAPVKLLEFVGDSITVGTTSSENALTAYGWLTGQQLGARHTQIAQGGACLVTTADGCVGMEDYFLKLNSSATSPDWDFSRYRASAVVINLGTNDLAHGTHTTTFQPHYLHLLEEVRAEYPNAAIFAMETFSKRFGAQTQAAVQTRNAAGDAKVYYVNTEGWLASTDFSDGTHPNDGGHRKVAARLGPIIAAKI